jgi:hypothetical protein
MGHLTLLPKRIIFSRKGWDSVAGGGPSPILENCTLMSLPIPDCGSNICYDDLRFPDGSSGVGVMVEELTGNRLNRKTEVHLDPDLRNTFIKRANFQSAFGQCGQSQFHLRKEDIRQETAETDANLFLFFGLYKAVYRKSGTWKYGKESPVHVIFGWLQVRSICILPIDPVPESIANHPHAIPSYIVRSELARFRKNSNTIYLGRERLTFKPEIQGAGLFGKFDSAVVNDPRRLTKPDQSQVSLWRMPSFCRSLSNMGKKQPDCVGQWWEPQRKGPGQEFVLNTKGNESLISDWLERLFAKADSDVPGPGNKL